MNGNNILMGNTPGWHGVCRDYEVELLSPRGGCQQVEVASSRASAELESAPAAGPRTEIERPARDRGLKSFSTSPTSF